MLARRRRIEGEERELYRFVYLSAPRILDKRTVGLCKEEELALGKKQQMGGEKANGDYYRMYQSMAAANEELRTMDVGGGKDAGRLFRIAQEKKGVFGHGGVPIEYARWQVDTPGKVAWNHSWTR